MSVQENREQTNVPEYYVDTFRMTSGAYGLTITFGVSPPHPSPGGQVTPAKDLVMLRMSLEHAKVMAMVLRRNLKNHERQSGAPINLPPQLYTQLGIALEDW
jgi:hypothetical protein